MPKVSVITPCFNGARYIGQMLASVRSQTFADWELIVVDDGSTDESASIVAAAAATDPRLTLIRQPNGGVSRARNAGFDATAASEYLLFLDADDMLDHEMLAVMTEHLDAHPDVGLAYCAFRVIDADAQYRTSPGHQDELPTRYVPTRFGVRQLPHDCLESPLAALMSNHTAYPSVCLLRRTTFERTKRWDPSFQISEDKDLVLQMAMLAPVHRVARHLVSYRRHETNVTATASVFPSLRRLDAKWWGDPDLTAPERAQIRKAILFDRRVAFFNHMRGAAFSAKQASPVGALRLAMYGGKALVDLSVRSALQWIEPRRSVHPLRVR